MGNLKQEAIRIISLWRQFGPGTAKIDLNIVLNEIVIPSSGGDNCIVVCKSFDTFEGLMARQSGEKKWVIGINTDVKLASRRNFTLAHEIAHFVGHRYAKDVFECTFSNIEDFQDAGLEKEANDFASQLLMPADVIRDFDKHNKFTHESVAELTATLGVSRSAAAYRWIEISTRQIGFAVSRDQMICHGRASAALYAKGKFFKSGEELPLQSLSRRLTRPGEVIQAHIPPRVWHDWQDCQESAFATEVNGYIYTYLDFGR